MLPGLDAIIMAALAGTAGGIMLIVLPFIIDLRFRRTLFLKIILTALSIIILTCVLVEITRLNVETILCFCFFILGIFKLGPAVRRKIREEFMEPPISSYMRWWMGRKEEGNR